MAPQEPTKNFTEETALGQVLHYASDNILGLDDSSPIAAVDFERTKDGEIVVLVQLGGLFESIEDAIPFKIDLKKDIDFELVDLRGEVRNTILSLGDKVAEAARDLVPSGDRLPAVLLEDLISDVAASALTDNLTDLLDKAILDLDFPELDGIVGAFEDAFDDISGDLFDDAVETVTSFYATAGVTAVIDVLRDKGGIDQEYIDALASIGDGFIVPEIEDLVASFLSDSPDEPDALTSSRFVAALEEAVFKGLILDDLQDEVFDDLLGLDGASALERELADTLADQSQILFKNIVGTTVEFFSGDLDLSDIDFSDLLNGLDIASVLTSVFSAFTADELADLVVDIDSLGEAITAELGSVIATAALGDALGALAFDGVAALLGEAVATAIGATVFQGIGAVLSGGLGLVAGSLVFEALDWATGGWLEETIAKLFGGGGSPQAFYRATFNDGDITVSYQYSKDTEANQRQAINKIAKAYERAVESTIEAVGVDIESYEGPNFIMFAWRVKSYDGKIHIFPNNKDTKVIYKSHNAEAVIRKAIDYTLQQLTFDQETMRGKAFDVWKADVTAAIGGVAPTGQANAFASLGIYMQRADFIEAYINNPTPYDEIIAKGDSPAAIAMWKDLVWAQSVGLLEGVAIAKVAPKYDPVSAEDATFSVDEDNVLYEVVLAKGRDLTFVVDDGGTPQNGSVQVSAHGGFVYTPDPDFFGTDSFIVRVTDGSGSTDRAKVTVVVKDVPEAELNPAFAETFIGTRKGEKIVGTAAADKIVGKAGDDNLIGKAGNDLVIGGKGADKIKVGIGDDTALGKAGRDKILGGPGSDDLNGGKSADIIKGGPGDDYIAGGPGKDKLSGEPGADVFVFEPGSRGDRVMDYRDGIDSFSLESNGSDLSITQIGKHAKVQYGDVKFKVMKTDAALLNSDDFLFT